MRPRIKASNEGAVHEGREKRWENPDETRLSVMQREMLTTVCRKFNPVKRRNLEVGDVEDNVFGYHV